jgi:hypothetical protein
VDHKCKPVDPSRAAGGVHNTGIHFLGADDLQQIVGMNAIVFSAQGGEYQGFEDVGRYHALEDFRCCIDDDINATPF